MNAERFTRLKEIYGRLAEIPVEQRGLLINEWCEGDLELRSEIERMLESDISGDEKFLEPPTVVIEATEDDAEVEIPKQLGDYEILNQLGEGGMGYVYLARQRSLNRLVALKLLPSRPGLQQKEIDRFLREAQSAAKLRHPRIVRIHDIESLSGVHFFAMDFIEGRDLGSEIQSLRYERDHSNSAASEPHYLPRHKSAEYFSTIVRIIAQIADALSHAHQMGIVHRDIKPPNILLNERLEPFLVDFGLARDDQLANITMSGDLVGSPAYMSPEQVVGRRAKITHRTDIYSLGVVLYELLTLRRPFEGRTSREVLNHVLEREPTPIRRLNPRVPVDLETICMTAISRSPDDRYASAQALAIDCEHFLNHEAIEARPPSILRRASIFLRRNRSESTITAVAVLAVIAAILFTTHRTRSNRIQDEVDGLERRLLEIESSAAALPAGFILETAKHFSQIMPLRSEMNASQQAILSRAERTLRNHIDNDLSEALDSITGLASLTDASTELTHAFDRLMGVAAVSAVAFPERSVESKGVVDPSIDVHAIDAAGNPVAAQVHACLYEPSSGRYLPDQTPTPANELRRIETPGYYRIVVAAPDGRIREFARWLQTWRRYRIVADFGIADDVELARMVKLAGGILQIAPEHKHCTHRGVAVAVEPFYLDRYEVSVGEYVAYCERSNKSLPQFFRERTQTELDALARRPAPFLTFNEMREYAESRGMRLPSHFELEVAVYGPQPNARKHAWGDAQPEDVAARVRCAPPQTIPERTKLEEFLLGTVDVDSGELSKSFEGVFQLQGNVSEISETPASELGDGSSTPAQRKMLRIGDFVTVGEGYSEAWPAIDFVGHASFRSDYDDAFRRPDFGFRCARSVRGVRD